VLLWVLSAALLSAGLVLSPSLLIELGPMSRCLASENQITRNIAETVVFVARTLSILAAFIFLIIAIFWSHLMQKKMLLDIAFHEPLETDRHRAISKRINFSLMVMLSGLVIGVCYVAFAPKIISDSSRVWINREDGLIEMSTALTFLCCAAVSAILAIRFLNRRHCIISNASIGWRAGWHGLLALFFFMCFGEEISWGQRIFGWETIEFFRTINVQNENNLHNLMGYTADHLFIIGTFCYGAVVPLVCAKYPFWRRAFDFIGLPVASVGLSLGFLLVSALHDWSVYRILPEATGLHIGELRELLSALGFALLLYESWLLVPALDGSPIRIKAQSILGIKRLLL
jgi:hypothetical protein